MDLYQKEKPTQEQRNTQVSRQGHSEELDTKDRSCTERHSKLRGDCEGDAAASRAQVAFSNDHSRTRQTLSVKDQGVVNLGPFAGVQIKAQDTEPDREAARGYDIQLLIVNFIFYSQDIIWSWSMGVKVLHPHPNLVSRLEKAMQEQDIYQLHVYDFSSL